MDKEQHRMRWIFALDEHALPHAVDVGKSLLRNAAADRAALLIEERPRPSTARQLQRTHTSQCASRAVIETMTRLMTLSVTRDPDIGYRYLLASPGSEDTRGRQPVSGPRRPVPGAGRM